MLTLIVVILDRWKSPDYYVFPTCLLTVEVKKAMNGAFAFPPAEEEDELPELKIIRKTKNACRLDDWANTEDGEIKVPPGVTEIMSIQI